MRGPGGNAGTTSTTGASATTSASAPARTARRRSDGAVIRTEKPRSPRAYLAGGGRLGAIRRAVPAAELPFEFMLNALRLAEGFRLADFERTTGLPAATVTADARRLRRARPRGGRKTAAIGATDLGFRFLNDLLAGFLPEENGRRAPGELYTAPSRFVPDRDFRDFVSEVP